MSGFQNIGRIPELKRRIIMTLALLAVYRIGVHIPTPGIDGTVLASIFERARGTLLGFFDMFAGGRPGEAVRLCSRHHALHQRVDHTPAPYGGRADP